MHAMPIQDRHESYKISLVKLSFLKNEVKIILIIRCERFID